MQTERAEEEKNTIEKQQVQCANKTPYINRYKHDRRFCFGCNEMVVVFFHLYGEFAIFSHCDQNHDRSIKVWVVLCV